MLTAVSDCRRRARLQRTLHRAPKQALMWRQALQQWRPPLQTPLRLLMPPRRSGSLSCRFAYFVSPCVEPDFCACTSDICMLHPQLEGLSTLSCRVYEMRCGRLHAYAVQGNADILLACLVSQSIVLSNVLDAWLFECHELKG